MKKERFGIVDGKEIFLYSLENQKGMKAVVSNFGALIVRLYAPDRNGVLADVALGYDTLAQYQENSCFLGAVIGPNANRIGNAAFTLEGKTYRLDANDGVNNLHSHRERGAHKRVWDATEKDNGILFTLRMKDGDLGFGGNKTLCVFYEVTPENELRITYDAESDQNTILNMTNHSYFNLDGQGTGGISDHILQIFASHYTPTDAGSIPDGTLAPVENTPMDFRNPCRIGARIEEDFAQLKLAGGYDHNWVCDGYDGLVRKIAVLSNGSATRTMEVFSDLPGLQFYAGNFLLEETGKEGKRYQPRCGLALETQYFPDSPNKPQFPSSVFGPKRPYHSVTVYRFL